MKKTITLAFLFFILLLTSTQATGLLTPTYQLSGTLHQDTTAFFVGKTSINGTFTGYPMDNLITSSLTNDMRAFPLIEKTLIPDISTVIVAEHINITSAASLEELYLRYYDHITTYSHVDLTTSNGVFLLGVTQGTATFSANLPFAVTGFLPLQITTGMTTRCFLTATTTPLTLQVKGTVAVVSQLTPTGTITLQNKNGKILWSGNSTDNYLLLQQTQFTVHQTPPLYIIPLNDQNDSDSYELTVTPAASYTIDLPTILSNISTEITQLGIDRSGEILNKIYKFDTLRSAVPSIANGAFLLQQSNDTITIDQSEETFQGSGFGRINTLQITKEPTATEPIIQAASPLIYLGNHFYNPQARQTSTGTAFPFELVIIWIIALCLFIYIMFFLRPDVNEPRTDRFKPYSLPIHCILLILTFILIDREISGYFSTSFIDSLLSQGATMTAVVFLLLEFLLWIIGYLLLALPVQLLLRSGFRYLGLGKKTNGLCKGISDLFIWVFCVFYMILLLNFMIGVFHLNSLFAIG